MTMDPSVKVLITAQNITIPMMIMITQEREARIEFAHPIRVMSREDVTVVGVIINHLRMIMITMKPKTFQLLDELCTSD